MSEHLSRLTVLRRNCLGWLASLACGHPALVVVCALVLSAVSVLGLTRLKLETGLADYLPEDSPVVQRFT